MGATEAVLRLQRTIALDAVADGEREMNTSFDLCRCGDARAAHHNRDGACLICRGHGDVSAHCPSFRQGE